jgi:DNA-binding transcriptional regulator YdaS (Cro superfamily)
MRCKRQGNAMRYNAMHGDARRCTAIQKAIQGGAAMHGGAIRRQFKVVWRWKAMQKASQGGTRRCMAMQGDTKGDLGRRKV